MSRRLLSSWARTGVWRNLKTLMAEDLLFTVAGSVAMPAQMISLEEAGLEERADLQEWVLSNPEILGPAIKIITFDVERQWGTPGLPRDRLAIRRGRSGGPPGIAART